MNKTSAIRVIVGMSGGVDSSVAALLLKQQGYHVEGLFMKNWEEQGDHNCTADQDLIDAQTVALKLGIRLHTVNFATEYWDRVFTGFLREYQAGRTPNPDILCNQEIKFKSFLNHAFLELKADYIATGHHARCVKQDSKYQLLKGVDVQKDQSYFLYALHQEQLSKSLFPVGNLNKKDVRELAQQHGFKNYDKKGSTGICFIGERKFRQFLAQYLPAQPGNIETEEGKVIGQHDGLMYYTLGQRQGFGVGGIKGAKEEPWYVIDKDLARNVLIIGQGHDHLRLFSHTLRADTLNWVSDCSPLLPLCCTAKTRYRQMDQPCTVQTIKNGIAIVCFDQMQRAITPGQSVVFYQGEVCLGGGIIQ